MYLTSEYMRSKLKEWRPHWKVDELRDEQIRVIYPKVRANIVKELVAKFENQIGT